MELPYFYHKCYGTLASSAMEGSYGAVCLVFRDTCTYIHLKAIFISIACKL